MKVLPDTIKVVRSEFPKGVLANRSGFAAKAELLHGFCFDRVELETPRLSYEPRWSCRCARCAAVWVASKSGAVMRIDLRTSTGRPAQTWFPGNREARTMYHHHDGGALGSGSHLLIGRDDGALDIISDGHREWAGQPLPQRRPESVNSFHLDSWWERRDRGPMPVTGGIEQATSDHSAGITAIAVFARPGQPNTVDILAATRYPWLYVIEATDGAMRPLRRVAMPGWIEWIIGPQSDDDRLVLISRGGEIVQVSRAKLVSDSHDDFIEARDVRTTALSLLPTAAMPFGRGSVVLGTTTGLFVVRANHDDPEHGPVRRSDGKDKSDRAYSEGIAVPVTQSPVLCLDRVEIVADGKSYQYITMGLENRRMRVIDAMLLEALVNGDVRPPRHDRSFAIEMGDAVLAVASLRPDDGPRDAAYVMAVLRDHSVRLFHVTSPQAHHAEVESEWEKFVHARDVGNSHPQLAAELEAARGRPPAGWEPNSWKYMLVDVVLPRLCGLVRAPSDARKQVVLLACQLAAGADRYVLHRLSLMLRRLAGDDVGLSLELSRAILAAVPHDDDRRWAAFIDSHLRELNALARDARDIHRPHLVAWTRFVRKYVLLGNRFVAKQFCLHELVEQNYEIGKYLDALIYQTRLSQRCYDLRWETRLGDEVAQLHTVTCAGRSIVVVATVGGKLAFLDETSGQTLETRCDGSDEPLAPFDRVGPARTLACAVARDRGRFRVVLSCTGVRVRPPGLAVIEVRLHDANTMIVESVVHAICDHETEDAKDVRVYALQPLPDSDDFVAGLETRRAPIGRLRKHGETWRLELAKDGVSSVDGFIDRPSLAPGKMPTRALAVAPVDDNATGYLVIAGSDDGLVRAVSFARGDSAVRWRVCQWHRVADAIGGIALGRHSADPEGSRFSCYVGTTAGDTFAFSVLENDRSDADALARSGDYTAQPLWRETHDGPVQAVRLWRTPLYRVRGEDELQSAIVLVVVTEKGRLCIYNHLPYTGRLPVSASCNYYFRGMRFDRVTLPDRVHALSMEEDKTEFVAAGAGGRLYKARLVYLRDSVDRQDPERRPDATWRPGGGLPTELWQRQSRLLAASRIDEPFGIEAARSDALKLAVCDLIRLEGGALAAYVLRERLLCHEPWHTLSADQLASKAQRLLLPLRPGKLEDAEKIKIILKTLCRSFLFVPLDELRSQLLATPPADPGRRAQTAAMCEVVAGYITRDLAHSTRAAARLRIVVVKELLRVQVLRHMAIDDVFGQRICKAVAEVIDSCLRDDERLVRIETLRALSVMLRNIGVMAGTVADDHDRDRLVMALFPRKLGSVTWLLELIVGGLQRFPSFTQRTVLVSGAWYYIKGLLGFFQIFPDRTLALCDYLVRRGLDVEVLAMCYQSLRRKRAATIRSRIANLYLLPVLEAQDARTEYIKRYDSSKPGHHELVSEMKLVPREALTDACEWHELDDAAMAHRLIGLLNRLARMWSVGNEEQLSRDLTTFRGTTAPRRGEPASPGAPASELEHVVDSLAAIAEDLAKPNPEVEVIGRLSSLSGVHGPGNQTRAGLTIPLRAIVSRVVASWTGVYSPPLPETGTPIGKYKLGAPFDQGGFGRLFAIDEPLEMRDKYVIKVLHRSSSSAAARFLKGARFNKELCDHSYDHQYVVMVTDIIDQPPRLAYVMRKYRSVLEKYLSKDPKAQSMSDFHTSPRAIPWTEQAAMHIGRALRAAHICGRCHGDVKATNILVSIEDGVPTFRLGDFDLSSDDTAESSAAPVGIVPHCLSRKAWNPELRHPGQGDDVAALSRFSYSRQWNDIAALSMVLYRMLTGEVVDPRNTMHLGDQIKRLHALASEARVTSMARRVIRTLTEVFDEDSPAFTIDTFLRRIHPPAESPEVRILFLGANPSKETQLALTHEVTEVRDWVKTVPNGRVCRIEERFEVRADRLHYPILEIEPHILHFSGHGNQAGELIFHGADGAGTPAPIEAITNVFRILRDRVRCVVLSACYSEKQAKAISEHVDVVIGMTGLILDDDAIQFAGSFYGAFALGVHVKEAFDLACQGLKLKQYERRRLGRDVKSNSAPIDDASSIPQIYLRPGFDAKTLYFIKRKPH